MIKNSVLLLFIFIFISVSIEAQKYNFKHFLPEKDGLSQSEISDIFQDDDGYIWLATQGGGLCKYNGSKFINYRKVDGLKDNEVNGVTQAANGDIWIATKRGLNIIRNGKFISLNVELYNYNLVDANINYIHNIDSTHLLFVSENKYFIWHGDSLELISFPSDINNLLQVGPEIYITTEDEGLFKINNYHDTSRLSSGFLSHKINCITEYKDGAILLGTKEGIKIYRNGEINSYNSVLDTSIIDKSIHNIYYKDSILYVGIVDIGIYMINGDEVILFNNKNSIHSKETFNCIFVDREEVLWLSIYGHGLYSYRESPFTRNDYPYIDGRHINSICKTNDGKILYGNQKGLFVVDGYKTIQLAKAKGAVRGVVTDTNNNIYYFISDVGFFKIDNNNVTTKINFNQVVDSNIPSYPLGRINDLNSRCGFRKILIGSDNNLIVGQYYGLGMLDKDYNFKKWIYFSKTEHVRSLYLSKRDALWIGTSIGLKYIVNDEIIDVEGVDGYLCYGVTEDLDANIWCSTDKGVLKIILNEDKVIDIIKIDENNGLSSSTCYTVQVTKSNEVLIGGTLGIDKISADLPKDLSELFVLNYNKSYGYYGTECNSGVSIIDNDGNLWFGTINGLYMYNEDNDVPSEVQPKLKLIDVRLDYESVKEWEIKNGTFNNILDVNTPIFHHYQNHLTFDYEGISMVNYNQLKYSFYLEGDEESWNPKSKQTSATYNNLNPGVYVFHLKVSNFYNLESESINFRFVIAAPFYQTTWFYLLVSISVIAIIILIVKLRERHLIKIRNKLESKVELRTNQLNTEKLNVENKNNQIMESINYAQRIQDSILPNTDLFNESFKEYFILNKPKDIVGGDFYWYRKFADICVIATVDCTGHGVPGGFMSMMGSLLLDKIVQEDILDTAQILKKLNDEIIRVLKQKVGGEIQDGMDLAICIINTKKKEICFSGARNGIIIISDNIIDRYDADLIPVGGSYSLKSKIMNREYNNTIVKYKKDAWLFMFSDGYYDQLNSHNMTSLGMKKFENILLNSIAETDKEEYLLRELDSWKGTFPQVDDLLVIGLKL